MIKTEDRGREGTEGRGQRKSEGQEKDECPTSNEKQKKMKQRAEVEKLGCLEWINIRV